jgi:hypothetical protein
MPTIMPSMIVHTQCDVCGDAVVVCPTTLALVDDVVLCSACANEQADYDEQARIAEYEYLVELGMPS